MIKKELIEELSRRTGFTKVDSTIFLNAFCDTVKDALSEGERIKIVDFGSFEVRQSRGRVGKNFFENSPMMIKTQSVPFFVPGEGLKEAARRCDNGK